MSLNVGMTVAKGLDVRFENGQDVLNAYWGYLSDGGLVIPDRDDLDVGQPVSLNVKIESSQSTYALTGRVVRRDEGARQAVIAFSTGEPHDMLLTEALAETENVPARRYRRFRVDEPARVMLAASPLEDASAVARPSFEVRLVNLSEEGCCFRLTEEQARRISADNGLGVGQPIDVEIGGLALSGIVMWARYRERGVAFPSEAGSFLVDYMRRRAG